MMRFLRGLLAALLLTMVAGGGLAARPAKLGPDEMELVRRAEAYLNGITTLKARFLQIAPNGAQSEGSAYLARPGRMRLDYDPPVPVLVVADGRFLIYYDAELKQVSYVGLDSTPAGILVRPQVRLTGGDLVVTGVKRGPGVANISVVQAKDPGAGELTLVFTDAPFQLRQWKVTDPQGQITTVSLFETQMGMALDPKLFRFVDPNFQPGLRQ